MRFCILILFLFLAQCAGAQNRQLLKKQLMQLMMAYPGKFRSIKKDQFNYDFQFTGAASNPMAQLRDDTNTVSMAILLPSLETEAEANAVFDNWVTMLNEVDFNGAKTKASSCATSRLIVRCRGWKLDTEAQSIDKRYANFSFRISLMKIGKSYIPNITIGDE